MTQATDLGAIGNQIAASYRARVNVGFQAVASQHEGATEPAALFPNMIWFDTGTGSIKLRNPTNTSWAAIGTIGPPMKWTNVDIPTTAWTTGDVKMTYNGGVPSGWILMNDGTIGNASSGASNRANPDTEALFGMMWNYGGLPLYAAGTSTVAGRGASASADFAANRHIRLPQVLGRVFGAAGAGSGLTMRWWAASEGEEYVYLQEVHLPPHAHVGPLHSHYMQPHGHPYSADTTSQSSWNSGGTGGFPTGTSNATFGAWNGNVGDGNDAHIIGGGGAGWSSSDGAGWTSNAGSGHGHPNLQPTTWLTVIIKL